MYNVIGRTEKRHRHTNTNNIELMNEDFTGIVY